MFDTIFVTLSRRADGNVHLTIGDDGVGFSDNQHQHPNSSMGLSLIQGMADQLEARLGITHEKGVSISVDFPYVMPVISPADLL